ncbi:TRAP transporter large permease [Thermoanaerobacteraceae bacterium SP2]|nr:TRAP transporter large permease [Thermoanaerobacteraceae bacterium SP2]
MTIAVLTISFLILIVLGVPIAISMVLSTMISLLTIGNLPLQILVQRMIAGINSFPLLAIPFFILAGEILEKGGASKSLVDFSNALVGRIRGGLAMIAIVGEIFLSGVSGSSVADGSTLGAMLLPLMKKKGYDDDFSAAVIASSATNGLIIPPSNTMIVYSMAAGGVSVGALFLGGFVPGLLLGLALMIICYFIAVKRNYPAERPVSLKDFIRSTLSAIPALIAIFIIIGGIVSGFFTATEAAVVAVAYSLLISFFIYRQLDYKILPKIFLNSAKTTAVVLFLIAASNAFAWILAFENVPEMIGKFILSISSSKFIILLITNILLLIVGCFMDMSPAILIFTPILLPIMKNIGVDPVHFGLIMMINLSIGLITPPVGTLLFLMSSMAKISVAKLTRALWVFYIPLILILLLITYVPSIVMFLPNLLMK